MQITTEQSRCRPAAASSCPRRRRTDGGFTLVELLICTLVLTTGMIGIAGLLGVTTQMHQGAREGARSARLAQEKMDELMKLNFSTDPQVAVGGSLDANVQSHNDTPLDGVTVRWLVEAGPIGDTRVLTVRVVNLRAQNYRATDLATIIRDW